jgi:hypothetical protein
MMRTMMSDHFFGTVLPLFPFLCLDVKGREDYLSIYAFHSSLHLDLDCKTLI